ncbi:MAG: hypothetical protein HYV63_07025 [Candidatus Schekmanbacteria bacterium]|nr:hypothetical protein [Candidatus Schekmanbacteria bacterium]
MRELVDTRREVLLALGEARGEARRRAEDVLAVFEVRGLPVTPKQRSQVLSCRDLGQLDRWHRRAITASSAAEALGGES